ncbi:MAG: hypothetical protein HOY76_11235 [Streptomyces sp.]|nr:hypothetical protein [Streptomyces sp.]NUS10628.1 hypothetical protein [Streptomyces sp.]
MTGTTGTGGLFTAMAEALGRARDFARTDFESFSHEELLDMVRHADPDALDGFSDRLATVVTEIGRIGTDLNEHIAYVDWNGTSGAAFRDWGKNVAKSTLALSDYAGSTGRAFSEAADTLRAVKRDMPRVPADAKTAYDALRADPSARHDPDGMAAMSQAHSVLEAARVGAADQMRKLAQSYAHSAAVVNGAQAPTYPPMPATFVPPLGARQIDPSHYGSTTGSPVPHVSRGSDGLVRSMVPAMHSGLETVSTGHAVLPAPAADSSIAQLPEARTPLATDIQSAGSLASVAPTQPGPQALKTDSGNAPHLGESDLGPLMPVVADPNPQVTSGLLLQGQLRGAEPSDLTGGPRSMGFNPPMRSWTPSEEVGGVPPARHSSGNGILGGRQVDDSMALEGRPGGQVMPGSVIGGRGATARMPIGQMAEVVPGMGGRKAVGRGGAGRLASEPGGVVGRTPVAEFTPRSPRAIRERRRDIRPPSHLGGEDRWIPTSDDVAPPVID